MSIRNFKLSLEFQVWLRNSKLFADMNAINNMNCNHVYEHCIYCTVYIVKYCV